MKNDSVDATVIILAAERARLIDVLRAVRGKLITYAGVSSETHVIASVQIRWIIDAELAQSAALTASTEPPSESPAKPKKAANEKRAARSKR